MWKITFTPKQQLIFDEIKKDQFLKQNFYFTGGTALSAVYLNHRPSEDLDFFSQEKFDKEKPKVDFGYYSYKRLIINLRS